MNIKRVIGIDPGKEKNSGLSYLEYEKGFWNLLSLGQYDEDKLRELVFRKELKTLCIALERSQASPKMGVVSAFNYGVSYGLILNAVTQLVEKHNLIGSFVSPVTWKTQFNLIKKPKSESIKKVKSLYKNSDPTLLKGLTTHTADSVLIALSVVK